jgi:uncharacterized protein YprB with RNaseH-like and TPR domain
MCGKVRKEKMDKGIDIFLDIETDWDRRLTVLGFRSDATGLVQLVGAEIDRRRVARALPKEGRLFTFNGHSFDVTCIKRQLGLDLRAQYDSYDLRWVCYHAGLRGGQKAIERRLGIRRELEGLNGWHAITLWERHREGDSDALATLKRYNAEDLQGLVEIKEHLSVNGLFEKKISS